MNALTPVAAETPRRTVYLDNLKVFLTVLVIAHHCALAFGAPGGWYYCVPMPDGSGAAGALLTMFVAINQAFFMSLFFFVAAYFTPPSCDKKGLPAFVRGRFKRLGIPLAVFFFFANPLLALMARMLRGDAVSGFVFFAHTGTGPLWFVLMLLFLTLCYAALRAARGPFARAEEPMPGNRAILGFVLGAAVVAFLVRIPFPLGYPFYVELGYSPLYIALFAAGLLARRRGWLEGLTDAQARLWFRLALAMIVALPVFLWATGALADPAVAGQIRGGPNLYAAFYAFWEPWLCVGISMRLIVLFRDRFDKRGPVLEEAAASAYTAYILHPFFVLPLTWAVARLPLEPITHFLTLTALAALTCFAGSAVVRRAPLLRRIL